MIIDHSLQMQQVIDFIDKNEILAFDIETTGLNPRRDTIIGFGISTDIESLYIVHKSYNSQSQELETKLSFDDCKLILNKLKNKKLLTFNGSFDCRFVTCYFQMPEYWDSIYVDVMLLKHIVDEERPFGLKDISKKIFGVESTQEQIEMLESIKANGGASKEYYKADTAIMAKYCQQDCKLTYRLYEYYLPISQKEGTFDFFLKDEVMPLYKLVTIPMEHRGVPVDVNLLEETYHNIELDIHNLEESIQEKIEPYLDQFTDWYMNYHYPPKRTGEFAQSVCLYAELDLPKTATGKFSLSGANIRRLPESKYTNFLLGKGQLTPVEIREIQNLCFANSSEKYMFNLQSKHHLKKLFFDKLHEEPVSKTPSGQPQCDYLFLRSIEDRYEFVGELLVFNKLNKIKSAYIERFLDAQENGIFYPSFFQHRTISGRYGSDLQQLNRPMEEGDGHPLVVQYNNTVRKFFISGAGYKFIDADYESLEPHVFAHISGEESIKDIFRKGHDFYSTIAIMTEGLQNVSADKKADNYLGGVDKSKRQNAKAYSLGIPYGLGSFKLSKQLNITQNKAEQLIANYKSTFPKLANWMVRSEDKVKELGKISSEAGRVRHMDSAPKIWYSHSRYILDPLKVWERYKDNPKKYEQMKYLRRQMQNYLNNGKNFQIQSLAASITNRACIAIARELRRKGSRGYIAAQIHDQIILRIPESEADVWKKTMQYLMENTYKISIPLKAPAEIGTDFYEAH